MAAPQESLIVYALFRFATLLLFIRYPLLIKSVSREDILRSAKTYLDPEDDILIVIGDLTEADMAMDTGKTFKANTPANGGDQEKSY
jgi:predicted Zn-dependent peptidase